MQNSPWCKTLMERELISWLREHVPPHPLLRLGLGDDAAVLRLADVDECVITVDMLTDQVDFDLSKVDPRRVGRKALAANLSDLAAMAAQPLAGVVALVLPRKGAMELAVALYEGMLPLAEQYDLAIAGGDTNSWDGPLAISITLLGSVTPRGPLRRGGAKPGDRILVTGSFGGSILGRHLDFEPRVREALGLHARYDLHAGIDVSDGFSLDLAHILEESRCGAAIDIDAVPIADDARRLADGRRLDAAGPCPFGRRGFRVGFGGSGRRSEKAAARAAGCRANYRHRRVRSRAGPLADRPKRRPSSARRAAGNTRRLRALALGRGLE